MEGEFETDLVDNMIYLKLSEAIAPAGKSSPNTMRNVVIAGLLENDWRICILYSLLEERNLCLITKFPFFSKFYCKYVHTRIQDTC